MDIDDNYLEPSLLGLNPTALTALTWFPENLENSLKEKPSLQVVGF